MAKIKKPKTILIDGITSEVSEEVEQGEDWSETENPSETLAEKVMHGFHKVAEVFHPTVETHSDEIKPTAKPEAKPKPSTNGALPLSKVPGSRRKFLND